MELQLNFCVHLWKVGYLIMDSNHLLEFFKILFFLLVCRAYQFLLVQFLLKK